MTSDERQLTVDVTELSTISVSLDTLLPGPCIRAAGVDDAHVRLLADCGDELPPILVQKSSMRVIDGMHRLRAIRLRGLTEIRVRLLDVSDAAAFLQGIAANIAHGLPLSLADRKAAARRLIQLHPEWSDRAIGRASGLSGKTVGTVRSREGLAPVSAERRTGLDGRARPVDGATGRRIAQGLLATMPQAPLREIARQAGVSPGTVRNVRRRMTDGADGEPARTAVVVLQQSQTTGGNPARGQRPHHAAFGPTQADPAVILANLRQDPSLKYHTTGRDLLRLLHQQPSHAMAREIIEAIPAHCAPAVAVLARIYAREWLDLAGTLEDLRPQESGVAVGERAAGESM